MLPDRDNFDNFQLDADGYAIPWSDIQLDWLIEHGDDPLEGDPEDWPTDYDSVRITLGPATRHEDRLDILFDDLPDDVEPDTF